MKLEAAISGVGMNLRLEFIDQILKEKPKLDFLEVIADNWISAGPHHKKLEKIREHYPISFHCVGMNLGGEDELNFEYLKTLKELCDKFQPFHLSDHLCFQAHGGHHYHDLLPFALYEKSLESIRERVEKTQSILGRQLLLENLSYYVEFKDSTMSEEEFLNELTQQADCFILLDLNNIWVNEKNLEKNTTTYLETINWKRVKELHIAGAEKQGEVWVDTHGSSIRSDVLKLVERNKEKILNKPILYERDNNLEELEGCLKECNKLREVLGVS